VIGSRHTINNRIWKIRKFNDAAGLSALFNFGHLMATEHDEHVRVGADVFVLLDGHRNVCVAGFVHALADEGREACVCRKVLDPLVDFPEEALVFRGTLPLL